MRRVIHAYEPTNCKFGITAVDCFPFMADNLFAIEFQVALLLTPFCLRIHSKENKFNQCRDASKAFYKNFMLIVSELNSTDVYVAR